MQYVWFHQTFRISQNNRYLAGANPGPTLIRQAWDIPGERPRYIQKNFRKHTLQGDRCIRRMGHTHTHTTLTKVVVVGRVVLCSD